MAASFTLPERDVGANCGDTLVAMIAANPSLNFLCLEADAHFFGYLERNIVQIRKAYPAVGEILPINALVGTAETSGVLTGEFGTKRVIASKEGQHATPLGIIASNVLSPNPPVSLIKVDVDGMDYDVLQSAGTLLDAPDTMLYFECGFTNEIEKRKYLELFEYLIKKGYAAFWLFDNFGTSVIKTASMDVISALFDYIWLQHQNRATRTFYYFDALACKPKSIEIARKVLSSYPPVSR